MDELIWEYVVEGGKFEDWWKLWVGVYLIVLMMDVLIVCDCGEGCIFEFVWWDWQNFVNWLKGVLIINVWMEKVCILN